MASKSYSKIIFFENRGILGWSIMLIVDWLIWWLSLERKILDSKKNTLHDKLTTPIDNPYFLNFSLVVF